MKDKIKLKIEPCGWRQSVAVYLTGEHCGGTLVEIAQQMAVVYDAAKNMGHSGDGYFCGEPRLEGWGHGSRIVCKWIDSRTPDELRAAFKEGAQ